MAPPLIVLKFGSSVLEDHDCLPKVVHQIYRYYRRGHRVLVVVSAIGSATDRLLGEARYWSNPPSPDLAVAELLATGERQSAALVTLALARAGVEAGLVSPADIKLTLAGDRLDAWPISVSGRAVVRAFEQSRVLVLPGFAGVHQSAGTALMGRGGTDLTAVFLACALDASECRLVKDVNGIYERDPASGATDIQQRSPHRYGAITYDEALKISGKLVQRKAIEYLRDQKCRAQVAGLLQEESTHIGAKTNTVCDLSASKPLKVLLLGLGQVGQGVYEHLLGLDALFEIAGILVRDPAKSREVSRTEAVVTSDVATILRRRYDIVLDVCGDLSSAREIIEISLAAGRPAVTASKRLVAEHGPALMQLAAKCGTQIRYSAVVGGSAPMLETVARVLEVGPVTRLRGVLNGTCNFVLDQLAQGVAFHTAVSEARLRGFAEPNVSRDLQGDDSADKLRVLARLAFGPETNALPITREDVSPADWGRFGTVAGQGVVRQVATFDPSQGGTIKLESLPPEDYLAGACGEENRLIISGAQRREWRVSGKGAGRWPTAEAVIADLLEVRAWLAARNGAAAKVSPKHSGTTATTWGAGVNSPTVSQMVNSHAIDEH